MKLTEIMIIKKDGLKLFQVDDDTLAKLTRIRGNLFKDDQRLRIVKDHPTPEPEPKISPEMRKRAEEAWHLHCMMQAAGERATTVTPAQPQPEWPRTPEEEWRTRPDIRAEFASLSSYAAYMRAQKAGRTKLYGRG